MSNFLESGSGSSLADVLGAQADTQATGINQAYAKKKRQDAAIGGASGRLNSGVQNYTLADTQAGQLNDLGGVYGNLSDALGQIPANDYLTQQENQRQSELAKLIGSLSQSGGGSMGALSGAVSGGASGAAAGTAIMPGWGTAIGGVIGAGMGAYGGSQKRAGY